MVNASIAPDVNKVLRERAAETGAPISRIVEEALRAALGVPEADGADAGKVAA